MHTQSHRYTHTHTHRTDCFPWTDSVTDTHTQAFSLQTVSLLPEGARIGGGGILCVCGKSSSHHSPVTCCRHTHLHTYFPSHTHIRASLSPGVTGSEVQPTRPERRSTFFSRSFFPSRFFLSGWQWWRWRWGGRSLSSCTQQSLFLSAFWGSRCSRELCVRVCARACLKGLRCLSTPVLLSQRTPPPSYSSRKLLLSIWV